MAFITAFIAKPMLKGVAKIGQDFSVSPVKTLKSLLKGVDNDDSGDRRKIDK